MSEANRKGVHLQGTQCPREMGGHFPRSGKIVDPALRCYSATVGLAVCLDISMRSYILTIIDLYRDAVMQA